jgi:hypothetical protein
VALAGLAMEVAIGAFVRWLSRDVTAGINPENCGRIARRFDDGNSNGMPSMTEAEVEAILGTPPAVYRTGRSLHPTGGFILPLPLPSISRPVVILPPALHRESPV